MAKNPLFDSKLSIEERLDWLIANLTTEEKLSMLGTSCPEIERLGIMFSHLGGEAAHGVQARHDQSFDLGEPVYTASFTQPIGLAATFDRELLREIGDCVGSEARGLYNSGKHNCLSLWAPTVDMERDPRWGRNEEAYGEDPYLVGEIAGSYIRGMRGDDPKYIKAGATLKHFYANNVEENRGSTSSNMSEKLKREYYLEPFRRCIEAGAEGIMTSYNAINGVPAMCNPEVRNILKNEYGLKGHVVCDGGAMTMVKDLHHYVDSHDETIAKSLHAGVDAFTEKSDALAIYSKKALEDGLITMKDIDEAIRRTMGTRIRLGLFDGLGENPYKDLEFTEEDKNRSIEVARRNARESVVLLKNDNNILPFKFKEGDTVAVLGAHADWWYLDWYSPFPYERISLGDALKEYGREHGVNVITDECTDRIKLCHEGRWAVIDDEGFLRFSEKDCDKAEVFTQYRWNYRGKTFRTSNGKLLKFTDEGIREGGEEAFSWFCNELFYIDSAGTQTKLLNWKKEVICTVSVCLEDAGLIRAVNIASEADYCLVTAGSTPIIHARETLDRPDTVLSRFDKHLLKAVNNANPNTVMVLIANYPYDTDYLDVSGILTTASGNMEMGRGLVDVITGQASPAGRLAQTWYGAGVELPDINDYDIKNNPRTHIYFERDVLYPFGYGKSYSAFHYTDLVVDKTDAGVRVEFDITNIGDVASDEVAQVYVGFLDKGEEKQLLAQFDRVKDIKSGECRRVSLLIEPHMFEYYDEAKKCFVTGHSFEIQVGASSRDLRLKQLINM
ncbi:MAG: glycoside hydrolase family 3 C-terminal domain-containing protein [Lachnospiraceae bacterium]|nr:glycoside hydrolase family 3 C-terminal domain-containing protein [Lachnospiraceae bacterium]